MENKTALTFGSLSSELIIQILHCCECPAIFRFAATCKQYWELVAESTSLQLHIELETNGLEIVKGSFQRDATYSTILEDLKQFHAAWRDLSIQGPIVRPAGQSRMLLWELREGFYIKAFSQSNGRLADALQFIPLDSETPDPPPIFFNFTFDEFTVDPGQGLVALVSKNLGLFTTIEVDLYSMKTGLAHPLAQHPKLTAEFEFERPFFSPEFVIEIMSDMVLASVANPRLHTYEILIWDWKTGSLLNRISSRNGICDFTFIDERHLVVLSGTRSSSAHLDTLELSVYAIGDSPICDEATQGQTQVVALPISQPILCLAFPKIQESAGISEAGFYLRSDPTPGRVLYTNSASFACPYTRTLSMTFGFRRTSTGWEGSGYYRVFLDGKFLVDLVHNRPIDTVSIPWSSWGECATRWFVGPRMPDHWICWMCSSKFIYRFSGYPYYCILDFSSPNTHRIWSLTSRPRPTVPDDLMGGQHLELGIKDWDLKGLEHIIGRLASDSSPDCERLVTMVNSDRPSILNGLGFEETITSRLPYRLVVRTNNRETHDGWQIIGDCIVGVNTRSLGAESVTIYKLNK